MNSLPSVRRGPIALVVAIAAVVIVGGLLAMQPGKTAGSLAGDANCDGTVNSIDAAIVLQSSAGLISSVPCPQNADVNGDGAINSVDAALILQYAAGLIPSLGPSPTATPTPRTSLPSVEVDQGTQGPGLVRHPLFLAVRGYDARGEPLLASSSSSGSGYTPPQIQTYLRLNGDGAGQTIAIVDAYDHPGIIDDLNTFSSEFGLPLACGTSRADPSDCFSFTKATPQGLPNVDAGWALEIALDVEWAHAVARKANIVLVETASNSSDNLLAGLDYAVAHGATVISNSWGWSQGELSSETTYDSHCQLSTAVCVFSSGDHGNPSSYPAYSPYVIAVGGSTLRLTSSGTVMGETAWSGSGGGVSQYEPRPAYQSAAHSESNRGVPDVSYDADPNTGFAVYDSVPYGCVLIFCQSGWFKEGGTSAGAPQWAAIIAVADQLRANATRGPLAASGF